MIMSEAISDSSTLIHSAGIGRLDLLKEFYERILIAPDVWKEVVEEGHGRSGALEVRKAHSLGWVKIMAPANEPVVRLLKRELHAGEAETIALAIEQQPDVVFLDESEARRVANLYGLRITGIIGILMRAKSEGRIMSLQDELDKLRNETGFWIDDKLYNRVLQYAEE